MDQNLRKGEGAGPAGGNQVVKGDDPTGFLYPGLLWLIKSEDGKVEKIDTDYVFGFFGLIMKLGPIAEWGLNLDKKTIPVNTENFQTNKEGIFAIGDICTYPGKLKLILSGFHEGALASVECFKRARPNEKYRFQFTTSSKEIQDRLGIKKWLKF